MNINDLLKKIEGFSQPGRLKVKEAFEFAARAHDGQKRGTGEPYIIHPLSTAVTVAEMELGCDAICAALLHDVAEDTAFTLEDIEKKFGKAVAFLVDGVTKLGKVRFPRDITEESFADEENRARVETYRKMFLATACDVRVVIIKLADRLHNMQTLEGVIPRKRYRIAKETLEIYAPIASRLNMGSMRGKLEDLAFQNVYPEEYERTKKIVQTKFKEREKVINEVKKILSKSLKQEGVLAEIHGRSKHLYSLYKKLVKYDNDFSQIYDLVALRVIVDSIPDCYRVLGIVHSLWKPLVGRIKDYIAMPKPNGYRSIHTTVFAAGGNIVEIQIRTREMHEEAEFGLAAHWFYSEKKIAQKVPGKMSWVKELAERQKDFAPEEFEETLKIDFFGDRIFVYSPKGDLYDLPEGATPLDFAYEVHSSLGHRTAGAKVNQQMVGLDYKLSSGEIVEIITSKKENPNRGWLDIAQTSKARTHIRAFLRKQNFGKLAKTGEDIINKELEHLGQGNWLDLDAAKVEKLRDSFSVKTAPEILVGLAEGRFSATQILRRLGLEKEILGRRKIKQYLSADSWGAEKMLGGIKYSLAVCCKPIASDEITGYVSSGKQIAIHRKGCKSLSRLDPLRLIELNWQKIQNVYRVPITIFALDRVGLLYDISGIFARNNVNIFGVRNSKADEEGNVEIQITAEVDSLENLEKLLAELPKIQGVKRAIRKN